MNNKLLAALIALLISLAFVACGGKSGTAETNGEQETDGAEAVTILSHLDAVDFGYVRNAGGDGIIITYKTAFATDVVLPDRIENFPVTGFRAELFRTDENVKSVTLPATVTAIPNNAFRGCAGLSDVTMPGVLTIGDHSFRGTGISSLTIPAVTTIGDSAFYETVITDISMPEILSIGPNAFTNCFNLAKVIFGEKLTTIGTGAFEGCVNLTEINVPASLTTFTPHTWGDRYGRQFLNCHKLPLAVREKLTAQGYPGHGF